MIVDTRDSIAEMKLPPQPHLATPTPTEDTHFNMTEVEIDTEEAQPPPPAIMEETGEDDPVMEDTKKMVNGTLLEAAFVDPAYGWPHKDGEGKNAVELQVMDDASFETEQSVEIPVTTTTTTETTTTRRGLFGCCKSEDAVVTTEQGKRMSKKKKKRRKHRKSKDNRTVPEGILIYRLDTADRSIRLVSEPSSNTDVDNLLTHMVVAEAKPGNDKSRRAIELVGVDGSKATLVACEQRSAIAWLEAMDMMLAHKGRGSKVRLYSERRRFLLIDS